MPAVAIKLRRLSVGSGVRRRVTPNAVSGTSSACAALETDRSSCAEGSSRTEMYDARSSAAASSGLAQTGVPGEAQTAFHATGRPAAPATSVGVNQYPVGWWTSGLVEP